MMSSLHHQRSARSMEEVIGEDRGSGKVTSQRGRDVVGKNLRGNETTEESERTGFQEGEVIRSWRGGNLHVGIRE